MYIDWYKSKKKKKNSVLTLFIWLNRKVKREK